MKNFYADCMHLTNQGVLCEFSPKKEIRFNLLVIFAGRTTDI